MTIKSESFKDWRQEKEEKEIAALLYQCIPDGTSYAEIPFAKIRPILKEQVSDDQLCDLLRQVMLWNSRTIGDPQKGPGRVFDGIMPLPGSQSVLVRIRKPDKKYGM